MTKPKPLADISRTKSSYVYIIRTGRVTITHACVEDEKIIGSNTAC